MKLLNKLIFLQIFFLVCPLFSQNIEDMLKSEDSVEGFRPYLKIGIKVDVSSFVVEGDAEVLDGTGKAAASIQGKYTVSSQSGSIKIGSEVINSNMIKFSPKFMMIKIDGRMFRGEIEVWLNDGKMTIVNDLFIEDYVRGVINKEAIPSWPLEAKKTQAVLARTFAVFQKMNNPRSDKFDLAPSVLDQVYDGLDKEDVSSNKAVDETKGEVITKGSIALKIYFHSTCGGHTASSLEVWKKDDPHMAGVECPYCQKSSLYRWTRILKAADIEKKLNAGGFKTGKIKSVKAVSGGQRVSTVVVNGTSIPVNKFRELVGFSVVWSNDFTVKKDGRDLVFEGKGAGHGVGVCQWGMAGMANAGKDYKEIINFYLKDIEIRKMY